MASHNSRANRTQLNAEISKDVVESFQALWRHSGRRRWEVFQEVVVLGIAEYRRREGVSPRTLDLLVGAPR